MKSRQNRPEKAKEDTVSQGEFVKLQRRLENLHETYRSIKEAEAEQRVKAGACAEEVSRLENQNAGLVKATETARAEMAEMNALLEELREAQENSKGNASEQARLEEERVALEAQLKEVQEASAARLSELEGELQTVKTASTATESSMTKEMSNLREEVEKLNESKQKLSETSRVSDDKISELRERARRFEEEKAASAMNESVAKSEVGELEGRVEELAASQVAANEDASTTQKKFNMLQGRWKKLNATCNELREELAAHDAATTAREAEEGLGERVSVLENEKEALKLELSSARQVGEEHETQMASLAEDKQGLVEEWKARCAESAAVVHEMTEKHEKLRSRWDNLKETYRSLKSSEEQERETTLALQKHAQELESQVSDAALERVRSSREAGTLRRAREVLMGRVSELEENCTVAEENAAGLEASAAESVAEKAALVDNSAALKDTIEGLEAQIAGFVEELDTTKVANSDQQEKVSELSSQAVDLAGEKGALLEVEAAMKAEIERLEARVSEMIDRDAEKRAGVDEAKGALAGVEAKYSKLEKRWGNLRATYRALKESEAEQRARAVSIEEQAAGLEMARTELEGAEAKASQVAEGLAAKVAKLNSSESGLKKKVKHLEMQAKEAEVKHAATAGAEESARERLSDMELEVQQLRQENAHLSGGRLLELEEQVEQLSESNSEFVASWEAQRRGADAVGFDLDGLLSGLSHVTELRRDAVEMEEANATLNQTNELSNQKVSALEVDLEDYEEKIAAAEDAQRERASEMEQLTTQIEELEVANTELSTTGDHSSERIVALEAELEAFEAEGFASEESVRVHKEEIELLLAQIAELQGADSSLTDFELPTLTGEELPTPAGEEDESDDDAMGVPAGHDPEDYEVDEIDDRPSWES